MAAANSGTVLLGTLGGIAGATAMFYGLTLAQPFGAYTPPDQNEAWQVKSEDRMIEGKWVRCSLAHCTAGADRRDCASALASLRSLILYAEEAAEQAAKTVFASQTREAAGPVHLNPIAFKISGAEFARQCLKPADAEEDDD